jgi:hypothetical protein
MLVLDKKDTLTDPELIQKWESAKADKLQVVKNSFHPSFDGLLSQFKKIFNIIPATLKANKTNQAQELRELALYLLVTYTKDLDKISQEMNVSTEKLNQIKQDTSLEEKYKDEINLFFKPMVADSLINLYKNLILKQFFITKGTKLD